MGLSDKFAYTKDAQRARGYELEKIRGGLIEQVRKMGPIFVPVTIHAMDLRTFGVVLLVGSIALQLLGYGNFWVPEALLRWAGG